MMSHISHTIDTNTALEYAFLTIFSCDIQPTCYQALDLLKHSNQYMYFTVAGRDMYTEINSYSRELNVVFKGFGKKTACNQLCAESPGCQEAYHSTDSNICYTPIGDECCTLITNSTYSKNTMDFKKRMFSCYAKHYFVQL